MEIFGSVHDTDKARLNIITCQQSDTKKTSYRYILICKKEKYSVQKDRYYRWKAVVLRNCAEVKKLFALQMR